MNIQQNKTPPNIMLSPSMPLPEKLGMYRGDTINGQFVLKPASDEPANNPLLRDRK